MFGYNQLRRQNDVVYIAATCRITMNVTANNADGHVCNVSNIIWCLAPGDFLRWRTTPDKVCSTAPPCQSCIPEKGVLKLCKGILCAYM